jgi:hypothetical protein
MVPSRCPPGFRRRLPIRGRRTGPRLAGPPRIGESHTIGRNRAELTSSPPAGRPGASQVPFEGGSEELPPFGRVHDPPLLRPPPDLRRAGRSRDALKPEAFEFEVRTRRPVGADPVPVLGVPVRAVQVRVGPGEKLGVQPDQPADAERSTGVMGRVGEDERIGREPAHRALGPVAEKRSVLRAEVRAPVVRGPSRDPERLAEPVVERYYDHPTSCSQGATTHAVAPISHDGADRTDPWPCLGPTWAGLDGGFISPPGQPLPR